MTVNIDLVCYVLAFVFFLIAAFRAYTDRPPRVDFVALGFAMLVLSLIF
jgi:hypothetical protein